jgi:hypothetical protein
MHLQTKPLLFAALINVILIKALPKIFTKPTNIKLIDDLVLFATMQGDMLVTSSLYIVLVLIAVEYAIEHTEGIQSPLSGPASL